MTRDAITQTRAELNLVTPDAPPLPDPPPDGPPGPTGGRTYDGPSATPLAIDHIADVIRRVDAAPPPGFLFRPVWPAGDYGMVSAEAKAGKSWAILDAAVAVAGGVQWLGRSHANGPGQSWSSSAKVANAKPSDVSAPWQNTGVSTHASYRSVCASASRT